MSFICGNCKVSTAPGIPAALITVKTRPAVYENTVYDAEDDRYVQTTSKGWEVVRQIQVCPGCVDQFPEEMRG